MPFRLSAAALGLLFALAIGAAPAGAAQSSGAADLSFEVSGTLPSFPCPAGCAATLNGSADGAAAINTDDGTTSRTAIFEFQSAGASASVSYAEPGSVFCPAVGSAAGTMSISGGAAGIVAGGGVYPVTGVEWELNYTYERVGSAAAIVVSGGTVTV